MRKPPVQPLRYRINLSWLRLPDVTIVATITAWLAVNAWFPPTDGWPAWLLVDWMKRVVLLVPLLVHPEINLWIRSAFTQGVYEHERRGLFLLRVVSFAILLLLLHYACEWGRWAWLLPLDPGSAYYPLIEDPYWRRVDLILGLALVAFSEEIVCRVVLLRALLNRLRHEWTCILVSAAIFGLFHWNYGLDNVISAGLLGIAFAVIYQRTRSIWPVAVGHYLINFTVFA